jgi:Copper amine oxidase N-terminal domain./Subtilase family.
MTFRIPKTPRVVFVTENVPEGYMSYGLTLIGADVMWNRTHGENTVVAVIDTGIDYKHPELKDRIIGGKDFTGKGDFMDDNGHGTHVSGIIAASGIKVSGVAPKSNLLAVKVLDKEGEGQDQDVADGIAWAVENGAEIISMSFGSQNPSPIVRQALRFAYKKGAILVAAAGNEGDENIDVDTVDYPARYPETIAVAAVDAKKIIAPFSSKGPEVDVAGPGVDIYSTYINGKYVYLSGTSMATPHISGAIALVLSDCKRIMGRKMTPEEMRNYLIMHTEDLGPKGKDDAYGYGMFTFNYGASLPSRSKEIKIKLDRGFTRMNGIVQIGAKVAVVDGKEINMDVEPFKFGDYVYVSARFLAEQLGAKTSFDASGKELTISNSKGTRLADFADLDC